METLERNADGKPTKIRMRKPYDMHQHVRGGGMLKRVVPMVARRFAGAIIMPNTVPPITTEKMAGAYCTEILEVTKEKSFTPLMTMYLTDALDPSEVGNALHNRVIKGVKYYPRGLTTNSDTGVKDPAALWTYGTLPHNVLQMLVDENGVLLLHAADGFDKEGNELDPYDQEKHFIWQTLPRIIDAHPDLKISVEHLSTIDGVRFIRAYGGEKLGCSLTAQHLLLDRRDYFRGGFRTHRFWWPIIQSAEHRETLRDLAKSDLPFIWLGSDSAPHLEKAKEGACCPGGVLTAHAGIELYAEAFEDIGALDNRFERFASINGPRFYGIEPSDETITLVREEWRVMSMFFCDGDLVHPFRLAENVRWKFVD